ncbi:MAG TPA: hypothetical protein VF068_10105 [Rubrobacter sp.]
MIVAPAWEKFVDHAELVNTAGNTTYLDDPLTSGNLDVVLSVKHCNPVVYDNHLTDVLYEVESYPPPASRRPI